MELLEKLTILSDAAKYDAACTSSGVKRSFQPGKIGNTSSSIAGCCHSFSADGRCITLLKVLMTNCCVYDCKYCVNRRSNDVRRTAFTPRELAELTIGFYRRNYIEGLFLSSGVLRNADYTTEQMIRALRILRQDLWEVIVSFIVSQNNNIPRIRKNLRDLCAMQGGAFPTPVALAAAQPETLRALGLGYRAEYLCAAGAHFAQADALDALRAMSYPEAHTALRAVKGVGPKVADCICLFGLHHVDAFPVDTHVKQILSAHYPKGFPFRRYAGCAGILQQYMFYYDLHGSAQAAP